MREGSRGDVEGVDGRLVAGSLALTPESQQLVLFRSLKIKIHMIHYQHKTFTIIGEIFIKAIQFESCLSPSRGPMNGRMPTADKLFEIISRQF